MRVCERASVTAVAVVFVSMLSVGMAHAECNADNSLYSDNFETFDTSWGATDDTLYVEDGALFMKPKEKGYWRFAPSQSDLYEDVTICVDTAIDQSDNADGTGSAILFWFNDFDNLYLFEVYGEGGFDVDRLSKGKWLTPVPYTKSLAIKKGAGQVNHLEIQLKGKQATLLINGTQVAQFKGLPPKDGSKVGLGAVSPTEGSATVKFQNFVVSETP